MEAVGNANRKAVMFGEAEIRQLRGKNKLEAETLDKVATQLAYAVVRVKRLQDKRATLKDELDTRAEHVDILERNVAVLEEGPMNRELFDDAVVEATEAAARFEINRLTRNTSGIRTINSGF